MNRIELTKSAKRKTKNAMASLLVLVALSLGPAGCAGPDALERDFGNSVANNIAQQVVNPQAGMTVNAPSVGLPPQASANNMEKYDKSFKGEEKGATALKMITGSY